MDIVEGFKTPLMYFRDCLGGDSKRIIEFSDIQKRDPQWVYSDSDLHVYPYTFARPAMLSAGCENKCKWCPTAQYYGGNKYFADHEQVLSQYAGECVHFMDEDFFDNPNIDDILKLTKELDIKFLAMTTYTKLEQMVDTYGEQGLADCGLRVAEVGLENVALYKKVKDKILNPNKHFEVMFLNLTFLDGECKETIKQNAEWMKSRSIEHPIHFSNGVWFAPGQYLYNYGTHWDLPQRNRLDAPVSRSIPTYVPDSFLNEDFKVDNLEIVNHFSRLVADVKMYPSRDSYNVEEFISATEPKLSKEDYKRVIWLAVGIRVGGIK
jgi:hypothetical protein